MSGGQGGADLGPLGVIDWGIGGLGLVAALHARGLHPAIRYVSDSGFTPYGKVPAAALRDRVEEVCRHLAAAGCSRVVVACNAASTVVDGVDAGIPVHGILDAGVRAALRGPGVIGVVGGVRTVESGIQERALLAAGRIVRAAVAQPWSALVERGLLAGPEVEAAVDAVLAELGAVDRLLLACTHYPALGPLLAARLPGGVLVDPMETVLDGLLEVLPGPGEVRAQTSGDVDQTRRAAWAAWGITLAEVRVLPV